MKQERVAVDSKHARPFALLHLLQCLRQASTLTELAALLRSGIELRRGDLLPLLYAERFA